jgi:flagellar assembly protein FliH
MGIERHQAAGAYRRWEPPSFDERTAVPADPEPAPVEVVPPVEPEPGPETPPMPEFRFPTAEELERMQEEARAEAHREGYASGQAEGREAGYQAGYKEGYEGGREQARAEAERLAGMVQDLERSFTELDTQITEELMGLALALARKMVHDTLSTRPDTIADTVRSALQELPQSHARIRLHPDDAALARELLGEQLAHGEHRLVEDPTLTRGGCLVEAGGTQVDATVETRWRRIVESMGRSETAWDADHA